MHADILWLSVQRWSTFMQFINAHANLRSSEDWTHNQLYLHDTLNPFITSVISSCSYFHPSSRMLILWNDASLCNLKCPFPFEAVEADAAKRAEVGRICTQT